MLTIPYQVREPVDFDWILLSIYHAVVGHKFYDVYRMNTSEKGFAFVQIFWQSVTS